MNIERNISNPSVRVDVSMTKGTPPSCSSAKPWSYVLSGESSISTFTHQVKTMTLAEGFGLGLGGLAQRIDFPGTHRNLSIEVKKDPLIGCRIVINCDITSDADIFAIKLVKDGIKIARNDTHGHLYLRETLKGRGNVTGCVTRRKANLSLTFDAVKTDDDGNYTCIANTEAWTFVYQNAMLTTALKPESVHITSEVKEETMLKLTCMGNIGNPSGDFSWHLCNETNCKPLTGNNIKLGDIEKVPGSCQSNGSSTLTFNHSKESSPFYINCLVTYHNDGATYNVIALKRFDYSVTSVQEDQQNSGSIFIRIAVAMLACFAIIIVVIYLVKKKKIKERRKLEKEEKQVDALICLFSYK